MKSFYEPRAPAKTVVLRSRVLFTVATSCKLWVAKLAHKRVFSLLDRLTENSIKKSVGLLEGNKIAIQSFCPSCLILVNTNYLSVRKEHFVNSGDIELNPGPAEILILLSYGRRFMCSSNTYS